MAAGRAGGQVRRRQVLLAPLPVPRALGACGMKIETSSA